MSNTYKIDKSRFKSEKDTKGSHSNEFATRQSERNYADAKKNYEEKTKNLFLKAQENLNKYGAEDFRTQILFDFLYMVDELNDSISLLESTEHIFSAVGSAVTTIDSIMNLNMSIISDSLGVNYGFFERIKRKRSIKKAMKNNVNRMNALITEVNMMTEFSTNIIGGMTKSLLKMKKKMEKARLKKMKKMAKTKTYSSVDIYNKYARKYNVEEVKDPTKKDDPVSPTGKEGNIDDIV